MASQYNLTIEAGTDFETVIYIGLGDSTYTFGTNKDYRATLKPSYGGTPQYSFDIKEKQAENRNETDSKLILVTRLMRVKRLGL